MSAVARTIALACSAIATVPVVTDGQSGLFGRDPEAAILRKAKRYNLVSVEKEVPGVFVDMRYKVTSAANRPLYTDEMPCLVHVGTAEKLDRANQMLNRDGLALVVWDAWRPPEAHIALWNAVRDPRFVVPPEKGLSWHCYGISVDVTLATLDGKQLPMPSAFDEFSPRAKSNYQGGDPEIARRVELLQTAMKAVGFRVINDEWWHFDDMAVRGLVHAPSAADLGIPMP